MFRVRDGHLKETEVRQTAVQSIVDTGAATLIINEAVQKELGLRIDRLKESQLAKG
jgi:predicted aspartyl protease